jgi:hypothetical protein
MATFIVVYHSDVVITNEIDSYEFVGMKEIFLLNEFLTHVNVVRLMRERLDLMDEGCEVRFEGRIDIGLSNGLRMKTMSPVYDENEWTTYTGVVMKSEIHMIELARMVAYNNVGDENSRSLILPAAIDEQHVECGVVLTPSLQETQDAEELPFVANNKTVLNMKHVCESVGIDDAGVTDTWFISGVDP